MCKLCDGPEIMSKKLAVWFWNPPYLKKSNATPLLNLFQPIFKVTERSVFKENIREIRKCTTIEFT